MSADELTLCAATKVKGTPHLYFFDVRSFSEAGLPKEGLSDVRPFTQVSCLTPPGVFVLELNFNPVLPSMSCAVFSDGSLALYMLSADDPSREPDCATLPAAEGVCCVSWSPKGKQLVAGKWDGSLTQYKPDLKEAKRIPPPPPSPSPPAAALAAVAVVWVSTYQFAVAYRETADPESRPGVYLVQSSKSGPATHTNFDDVCYSTGDRNRPHFLLTSLADWGTVLCASANAMEVGRKM